MNKRRERASGQHSRRDHYMTKQRVTVFAARKVQSMQPRLSRYDVTVDDRFKDKVILPGFIEPHWKKA